MEKLSPTTRLYLGRAFRDFGDGFVAVLLPVYLIALGLGPFQVGLVATLALLGSALMTLGIGLQGASADQRLLLFAASGGDERHWSSFAASSTYPSYSLSLLSEPSTHRQEASASSCHWNAILARSGT